MATIAIAGCGGGDDDGATTPSDETDAPPAGEAQGTSKAEDESGTASIWLTTGEQLKPVDRELGGGDEPEAAAKALVKGPTAQGGGRRSRRRYGDSRRESEVESVEVEDDGTAVVEVSKDFLKGVPADPEARDAAQDEALDARLSQVTYTLTQFDDVDSAKVVAGGITTGPPRDRSDFAKPAGRPAADQEGARARTAPVPRRSSRSWRTSDTCRQAPSTG